MTLGNHERDVNKDQRNVEGAPWLQLSSAPHLTRWSPSAACYIDVSNGTTVLTTTRGRCVMRVDKTSVMLPKECQPESASSKTASLNMRSAVLLWMEGEKG